MNLQFYDKKNAFGRVRDDLNPIIKIIPKMGFITLNHRACELLVIEPGQRVVLAQDESSPKEWYIAKTDSLAGFTLRSYPKSRTLHLQSTTIVDLILKSLDIQERKRITFQLANKPTVTKDHLLFAILINNHA